MVNNIEIFLIENTQTPLPKLDTNNENFKTDGYFKYVSNNLENEFSKNIFLYFPVSRYYEPAWYNRENELLGFNMQEEKLGMSKKNFIKSNVLEDIEKWIFDLLLDRFNYEMKTQKLNITFPDGVIREVTELIGYEGKNTLIINLINSLLKMIYSRKYPNIENARVAVSPKEQGRKLSIVVELNDDKGENKSITVATGLSQLSSGETMLLSLFGSILKEYDDVNIDGLTSLDKITGIVLIDEIEFKFTH